MSATTAIRIHVKPLQFVTWNPPRDMVLIWIYRDIKTINTGIFVPFFAFQAEWHASRFGVDGMSDHSNMKAGVTACSAEYNRIFMNVLHDKGVDVSAWLQKAALDIAVLTRNDGNIRYHELEGFFKRNVETLGVDGLGLYVGERTDITSHGAVAHAVLSCADYVNGFQVFQRFMKLRTNFMKLSLRITHTDLIFEFDLTEAMTPYVGRFYLECAISGTYSFLSQYLQGKAFTSVCQFSFPRPDYAQLYQTRFGDQIRFDCNTSSLAIPRHYLDAAAIKNNPPIYAIAVQQCEHELRQFKRDECIVSRTKALLYESPWMLPTQEVVARHFFMGVRTFRRKLSEAGTTYQAVIDSVKEALAKEYLKNTPWSVPEIAEMLGYTETGNFKRAFKRWTNLTPMQYRLLESTIGHAERASMPQVELLRVSDC